MLASIRLPSGSERINLIRYVSQEGQPLETDNMKLEQIQKLAKDKGAEFLDLKFCDLVGNW
ncbi:MAG: hypothetical protein NT028_13730, partial [candidate division Zixibacteria bacterium]|nr:hypothetical protein [candidate division Zixibacteria bacterium]